LSSSLSPEQVAEYTLEVGVKKANNSFIRSFLLAVMGGMFIALAAIGSLIATSTIDNFSVSALVGGLVFSTGLVMVVIAGGDLFTGNVLIILSVLQKRTHAAKMVRNLAAAFLGNLVGAMGIVFMVQYSGLLTSGSGAVLKKLILKASHKLEYPFYQAFLLGVLCNLMVCTAVWMMYSAKDTAGKVLACIFPITVFVLSGYEHIVANMYYIPAGILAASNSEYVRLAGLSADSIANLTFGDIGINFVPVFLGNLVGGLIIGTLYNTIYLRSNTKTVINKLEKSA